MNRRGKAALPPPLEIPGDTRLPQSGPSRGNSLRIGRQSSRAPVPSGIDWRAEPQVEIAKWHRKMVRPCWVPCEVDKQHPTGRRTFDPDRWQDSWLKDPDKHEKNLPRLYPIWGTTPDELAVIGGPGVRLYFALLRLVSSVFFVLAVLMTAPIVINWQGNMYKLPAARDFVQDGYGAEDESGMSVFGRTFWARTTLGALTRCDVTQQRPNNFAFCDVPEGTASSTTGTRLLVYACVDLLATFLVLVIVKKVNKRKLELDELSDAAMISMSDYTVQLLPKGGYWRLPEKSRAPAGQQQSFKNDLRKHVETYIGRVAKYKSENSKHSQLAIWLAFPEEHRIACWEKKVLLLKRLEYALGCLDGTYSIGCGRDKATSVFEASVGLDEAGSSETVQKPDALATKVSKLVMQLEELNEALDREAKTEVVCAFVAFQDEKDQEGACDLVLRTKTKTSAVHPEVDIQEVLHFQGRDFRIREAPEPDTIKFSHLQYSSNKRNARRSIAILTLIGVLVGFTWVILTFRNLSTNTAFESVCPAIVWEPSSDYALCDGAYAGNFTNEAQRHYKDRWQYVLNEVGRELPDVATVSPSKSADDLEVAECKLPNDSDCCTSEQRTWVAAAEAECTRVWTVDANLSFFPTTRGDGEIGLRQCDIDRNCQTEPLPPDPGRMPGHRPLCKTMDCPTDVIFGALWEQNAGAVEQECVGGLNMGCDPESSTDVARCCSKKLEAEMSKGHSVEAVCYHCICDCLGQTNYNTEPSEDYENGCPSPAGGWTSELIETYCASDDGWDRWSSALSRLSMLNSVITTTLNQVLKAGLEAASALEKAHTEAQEQSSLALKVAMAQFTNTVLLSMVSTMYFEGISFVTVYPVDGLTPWANARWHYQVGTSFMMTMAINQCLPPAIHAIKYFAFRLLQRLKVDTSSLSCGARTQNQLNQIYEFNQWKLASSYGEVLFVLSSTLLLCTALPMLLWISAFGMGLKYWGDKTAVLRCYRKPPLYSSDLFAELDLKLYTILAAHLVTATYFLSVAGGTTPDEAYTPSGGRSTSDRLNLPFWFDGGFATQIHVWPVCISAVVMVCFPLARICHVACRSKEHRLVEQRKKKLYAVNKRVKRTQLAMLEALKRRHSFSDNEMNHVMELATKGDQAGQMDLKEALAFVRQERDKASQQSGDVKQESSADKTHGHEKASSGIASLIHTTSDKIARATESLISSTDRAINKAEDIMHNSPVHKLSGAVGHAGKAVLYNTGKGLAMAAAGAETVAGKVAGNAMVNGGTQLVKRTTGRVRTATHSITTATRSLTLGRTYDEADLDLVEEDELIRAVSGSLFGLALGDLMSDRTVEDPDAALPTFSDAHEHDLLINTHDHYDMDAASTLLDLQRSFRDALYDKHGVAVTATAARLQPKFARVRKEDAGGETMTVKRMSLAIGVYSQHNERALNNTELMHSLRPEMSDDGLRGNSRRGEQLPPIERETVFMAP